ncbi:hypothetical protein ACFQRL_14970 [Microbacterium fluvii]|uniref:Bacterial spore germination immunoglobulin-like domain-containing protein n=1 Tax=Microbacterium fluvii TaxID=415215 RepID=A0ABW2HH61_9MICO|nr:hypothetical protein [Microbacterium fluvii]MCU4673895.1 hypothetical protein [Microbacterium fluvii]
MHRRIRIAVVVAMIGMLSACSPAPRFDPAPAPVPTPAATEISGDVSSAPESFVVRTADTEVRLAPSEWSVDDDSGTDEVEPPGLGSPDEIFVFVPIAGWYLSATQYGGEVAHDCLGPTVEPEIEDLGSGWTAIRPTGPAGDYAIELSASSGPGTGPFSPLGTMTATVQLTTTEDAEQLPEATAWMSLVSETDTGLEAGDLSIELRSLYPMPAEVSAAVTITAAGGAVATFEPEPTGGCLDLSFFLVVPFTETAAVAELGDLPYAYDVELVIDGETYTGTAQYSGGDPLVQFEFDRPLP